MRYGTALGASLQGVLQVWWWAKVVARPFLAGRGKLPCASLSAVMGAGYNPVRYKYLRGLPSRAGFGMCACASDEGECSLWPVPCRLSRVTQAFVLILLFHAGEKERHTT